MTKLMPVTQIRKEWEAWMKRRRAGDTADIVWSDDEQTECKTRCNSCDSGCDGDRKSPLGSEYT